LVNGKSEDFNKLPLDIYRHMVYISIMRPAELKEWRQRIGCSQAKLAGELGVDVMTVSRWERGVREIPSFLHLALGYLELKGVETKKRTKLRKGGK